MEIGLVGLGRMGGNMRQRIRRAGHTVVGYDRDHRVSDVDSLAAMVEQLPSPKVVWVMVPAGDPTHQPLRELGELLSDGDVVIDGGNSRWTDDLRHAEELGAKGIGFIDCGGAGTPSSATTGPRTAAVTWPPSRSSSRPCPRRASCG